MGPLKRRSLGFPGFPVDSCGFGRLHVVLFRENHSVVASESSEVGNRGPLGMTLLLGLRGLIGRFGRNEGRTADPSTTLRSGRDDKGERGAFIRSDGVDDEQQVPPLRCAPVGMTLLFGTDKERVETVFIAFGEPEQHDFSGRDDVRQVRPTLRFCGGWAFPSRLVWRRG